MKKVNYDKIPSYVKEFLYYYRNIKNASEKTIHEYYLDLRTFFRFIKLTDDGVDIYSDPERAKEIFDNTDASSVTLKRISSLQLIDLYSYMDYCNTVRNDAVAARCRKTSSIKSFFNYLCKQNMIDENPSTYLNLPKKPKTLPTYLSEEQAIQLLESIDGNNKARNYAIITLFLNCGIRLSELVGINLRDITGNTIRITGKGNKTRILYLSDACISAIEEYMKVRPKEGIKSPDENALFISRNMKRISNRMVQTLVNDFMEKAGLDTTIYSTHKLRHTAATLMYQNGTDVRALQEVLGHENLGTTQIYTHTTSKQIEQAILSNPLSDIKAPSGTLPKDDK